MDITILLVDDEAIDLEWMRVRVAGNRNTSLRIAGTAKSGFAALQLMEQERIDIIFSDIRMPIMSGMEFARKAKLINPAVHIVFISGHEDFSYAKEAIQLNAYSYLLKPVDNAELDATIAGLCTKVVEERQISSSVSEAFTYVQRELLLRWFRDTALEAPEERLHRFLTPLLREGTTIALIEMDDMDRRTKPLSPEERRDVFLQGEQFIREFVENHHMGTMMSGYDNRYVLLTAIGEEESIERLENMVRAFSAVFPFTITVGLGKHVCQLEELRDSFRQAETALSIKWILGKNKVLRDALSWQPGPTAPLNLESDVDEMLQAMLEYDLVKVDDCITRLFQRDFSSSHKSKVYDLIIRITSRLHSELERKNENLYELLSWESHMPVILLEFETIHDLVSWLRRRFFELSELLFAKRKRQERKFIYEIIKFVEERLEYNVTLKEVAARFDYTPNYLGHLFKVETGTGFGDFLNEVRMKRACELLDDPLLKVYEIAERVGYKNVIYFNRQFKQATGMTPGEYRKKNKI